MASLGKGAASLSSVCSAALDEQKALSLYREFTTLIGDPNAPFPRFLRPDGRSVVTFCSNDYLAMSRAPGAIEAARQTLESEGVGAGGSRNIGGTRQIGTDLEAELADLHRKPAALVFNSGYIANLVPMKVVAKKFDAIVFSDRKNHASIIDGLDTRKTGAEKNIFAHNDPDDLRRLMRLRCQPGKPAVVIFESLYSMEGDYSPISELVAVAREYGASVFLNEVHAVGVIGPEGGGVTAGSPILDDIDLVLGTLGKGYGTFGGYIAGDADIVDAIRCFGSGIIFTTALPPFVQAAALANVRHLRVSEVEREAHARKNALLKQRFDERGIPMLYRGSHIIAVPVGDERSTLEVSMELLDAGFYVTPIRFPTVPKGEGRLRVTVTPAHAEADIEAFADVLASIYRRLAG